MHHDQLGLLQGMERKLTLEDLSMLITSRGGI